MPESVDLFVDGFRVNVMALGCTLTFSLSHPDPTPESLAASAPLLPADRVATIRMTPALMKGMTFILRNQISIFERVSGTPIQLPSDLMAGVMGGTDRSAWDRFWGESA